MHFISKHRLVAVGALVVLAGAVLFLKAFPRPAAVKPVLQRALVEAESKGETVPVIVELEEGIFRVLSRGKSDALESIRGFAARLSVEEVKQALELEEVVAVHFDAPIQTGESHAKPLRRKEERKGEGNPFLRALGADQMHRWGLDGTGISVAVVDSGIADLPGLRVVERVDFTGDEGGSLDPYGHGTHVAGILGFHAEARRRGEAEEGSRLLGVAPGVDLVDVRVIDSGGNGRTSTLIRALEWIRGNAERLGIRVVNLSLGHPPFESYRDDPLGRAVEGLIESGLVVVASAGNLGKTDEYPVIWGAVSSPANHPGVIAVSPLNTLGTVTHSDDVATSYGSRGPAAFDGHFKPDITAPGNRIPSLLVEGSTLAELLPDRFIGGSPRNAANTGKMPVPLWLWEPTEALESDTGILPVKEALQRASLFELSGASMAVPFVSGTVAIMLQANPELGSGLVKSILQLSAVKLEQPHMFEQGNGLVNTRTAVELELALGLEAGVRNLESGIRDLKPPAPSRQPPARRIPMPTRFWTVHELADFLGVPATWIYERPERPTTFRDLAEGLWVDYQESRDLKPSTRYGYDSILKIYLIPEFGDRALSEITPRCWSALFARLRRRELSAQTQRNVYALLNVMFEIALESDLIETSPVRKKLHRPKVRKVEKPVLTPEQFQRLLFCLPERWKLLFVRAAVTGLRAGELLALRWSNLDLLQGRLKAAGIPRGKGTHGFHLFRHTVASIIHERTGSLKNAQAFLGHSQLSTTANIYVHVDEAQSRRIAETVCSTMLDSCPLFAQQKGSGEERVQ